MSKPIPIGFEAIGRAWLEDSSLERWFPFSAQELTRTTVALEHARNELAALKAERDELREALAMLIKEIEGSTYEHDGHRSSGYGSRVVCTLKAWNLARAVLAKGKP